MTLVPAMGCGALRVLTELPSVPRLLGILSAGTALACAGPAAAMPLVPLAATIGSSFVTVDLVGGGPYVVDIGGQLYDFGNGVFVYPNPTADATASVEVTASAVATDFDPDNNPATLPLTTHTVTFAGAKAAEAGPAVVSGGVFPDPVPLAAFTTESRTSAVAETAEPLFARSQVRSDGTVPNITVQSLFQPCCLPPPDDFQPGLQLTWDIGTWQLQADALGGFAFLRETVTVSQAIGDALITDTIGFATTVHNGQASFAVIDSLGTSGLAPWIIENAALSGSLLWLDDPPAVTIQVPFASAFVQTGQPLTLSVASEHLAISAEAPPRAALRTAATAGQPAGHPPTAWAVWDPARQMLAFSPLPVSVLSRGQGLATDPAYADDPFRGGFIELDPLIRIWDGDAYDLFWTGALRLVGADGQILMRIDLSGAAFEAGLFDAQGFNLFAPILSVTDIEATASPWLTDYLLDSRLNPDLLPELFIGLDVAGFEDPWAQPFQVPAWGMLSFAGNRQTTGPLPVTAPAVPWTMAAWLIALAVWRRRRAQLAPVRPK